MTEETHEHHHVDVEVHRRTPSEWLLQRTGGGNSRLANIAAALVLLALVVTVIRQQTIIDDNSKATDVLCAQGHNLNAQIKRTQDFLAHPEDFPAFNTPELRKLTQAQLAEDMAEAETYDDLDC